MVKKILELLLTVFIIYNCISFLLLPKQITTNLEAWNNTNVWSHCFCRSKVQLDWTGSSVSHKAKTKLWARTHSLLKTLGKDLFPSWSGCWQNSVPCGCRTEVTVSLLAVSWGPAILFWEATCSATYASHVGQSLWASSLSHFKLLWADLPFCYISLIPARKSSLLLRSQELDWVHLDIPEYFLHFKVFNLNYTCKDPFAT